MDDSRVLNVIGAVSLIYLIFRYPLHFIGVIAVLLGLSQIVTWVEDSDKASYPASAPVQKATSATIEKAPARNYNVTVMSDGKITARPSNLYAYQSIPGVKLSLTSDLKGEYKFNANAVICSIVGPIYYNSQYGYSGKPFSDDPGFVGMRHLMLAFYSENYTGRFSHPDDITLTPKHSYASDLTYMATTPADVVTSKDKIEWCQVGERMADVAQSVGVTVVDGVIADRFQWLQGGGVIPRNVSGHEALVARMIRSAAN